MDTLIWSSASFVLTYVKNHSIQEVVNHIDDKLSVCKNILSFLEPQVFHCIFIYRYYPSCDAILWKKRPFLKWLLISCLLTFHFLSCFMYRQCPLIMIIMPCTAAVSLNWSHLTFPPCPGCSSTITFSIMLLTGNVYPLVPNDFQCENNYSRFYLISPFLTHKHAQNQNSLMVAKMSILTMRSMK